jgi:glycosyltransferase involved in cell wall biosynthesis
MRAAIVRLTADEALRAKLGSAGRAHVLKSFTVKRLVEQTAEIYRGQPEAPIGEMGPSLPQSAGAL